jgi:hypothetical protein
MEGYRLSGIVGYTKNHFPGKYFLPNGVISVGLLLIALLFNKGAAKAHG